MQSIERATALLRDTSSLEGATAIFRELGFAEAALPLDSTTRSALGLPPSVGAARITQGRGALRGLAVDLDGCGIRESLTPVVNGLARRSPQLLWIVVAIARSTRQLAIASYATSLSRARIVSLLCNQNRLFESDAETLCALSAAAGDTDLIVHARWLDVLGREAITRRFFRALGAVVGELADSLSGEIHRSDRMELALLYTSRLIFLSFLETKGWLDGDFGFLSNGYSRCISEGGRYQRRVLEPLFFGTLNTAEKARSVRARSFGRIPFLNGGLFARSNLEKRRRGCVFTDEAFGNAYGSLLSHYRFSGREESTALSEAAIDPEMLGKAFEALMASDERKTSGAFYTPQALVEDVVERALHSTLHVERRLGTDDETLKKLRSIRILDPACGSGAFLVRVLERIASLRLEYGEEGPIAEVRRRVLMTSIFGVDLNPIAVWLCELRLWLSIVIESADGDPMRVVPLPNLDRHIRVGDSLAGGAFDNKVRFPAGRKLTSLRNRYMRACGPRKLTLARAMDREERDAAINVVLRERARLTARRKELLLALRARDLFGERHQADRDSRRYLVEVRSRIRETTRRELKLRGGGALPFSFAAHFADVAATLGSRSPDRRVFEGEAQAGIQGLPPGCLGSRGCICRRGPWIRSAGGHGGSLRRALIGIVGSRSDHGLASSLEVVAVARWRRGPPAVARAHRRGRSRRLRRIAFVIRRGGLSIAPCLSQEGAGHKRLTTPSRCGGPTARSDREVEVQTGLIAVGRDTGQSLDTAS